MTTRREKTTRTNRFAPRVEVLEDRALLSFLPAVNYSVGPCPQGTMMGSFRNNGILDFAVPNNGNGTVSVRLGNGDGTFGREETYFNVGQDLVGSVAGQFRTGIGILDLDLVVADRAGNALRILRGNGDGTFSRADPIGGFSGPLAPKADDFDLDGNLDLVATNSGGSTVSVLLGNGDGSFQSPVNYTVFPGPRDLKPADFDLDGDLDLVVTPSSGEQIAVLLGNGDGTFAAPVTYTVGDPSNVTVGVFRTGSGILDLAVTNRFDNTVSVLLGNGDGTFQPEVPYSIGQSSWFPAIAVGDFDQDGNLDLVATNFGGGTVSVLLGNGDGTFGAATSYAVGSNSAGVEARDLNGDGSPDMVVTNCGSNNVSILVNDAWWPDRRLAAFSIYPDSGTVTAGMSFDLHVLALDFASKIIPNYAGEIVFWSTDPQATTPVVYQFQPADQGIAYFPGGVTLRTRGTQELYVFDTATYTVWGYAVFEVTDPGSAPGSGGGASSSVVAVLMAACSLTQAPQVLAAAGATTAAPVDLSDPASMALDRLFAVGREEHEPPPWRSRSIHFTWLGDWDTLLMTGELPDHWLTGEVLDSKHARNGW